MAHPVGPEGPYQPSPEGADPSRQEGTLEALVRVLARIAARNWLAKKRTTDDIHGTARTDRESE
jgi:hypothetical protein